MRTQRIGYERCKIDTLGRNVLGGISSAEKHHRQFRSGPDTKSLEDTVQLSFDRAYAAATGSRNLGIGHAFAAEDGDLPLAWRQRCERRGHRFAGNRKVWTVASLALEGDQKT